MTTGSHGPALSVDLKDLKVLVTGGTKGIGAAIAARAAEAGADVMVAARSVPDKPPMGSRFIQADVSTQAGTSALAASALEMLGGIDVLVNNAGLPTHPPVPVWEMTDADWMGDLNVNLLSAIRMDRAIVPAMIERGSGVIIHMSSFVSRFPPATLLGYAASKAALNSYSKGLSNELATHGIRVNAILPGLIETEAVTSHLSHAAQAQGVDIDVARQNFLAEHPVPKGYMGAPDDVARLVVFLASAHASYLTGGQFAVDGGMAPAS